MRTSYILKYFSYFVLLIGIIIAANFLSVSVMRVLTIAVASIILWLLLRLAANIGQILFDMKAEFYFTKNELTRQLDELKLELISMRTSYNEIDNSIQSIKEFYSNVYAHLNPKE